MMELVPLFLILLNLLAVAYIVERVVRYNLHIPKEKKSFYERFFSFTHGCLTFSVSVIGAVIIAVLTEGLIVFMLLSILLYMWVYSFEGLMEWIHAREKREYIVIWSVSATMFVLVIVIYFMDLYGVIPDFV
ncbi:uncharacterized membrane protein YidH (DUF202 family) [Alkalibacillus filiformis]|uniref:Uncharacterized membrane protein YidH (DUF202 family) n=1 Tax=Alkalibacillus filiformis TaxID=200990 RepID=A0ABU0DUS0_9BACI|nr:DUF4181 domain-containing protein [Alkalibacillus filiformis]MDQ0352206.1 uncharacterized membrane protein YidH (DUF202 family) [Alkalibacillus filiformis]